MLKIAVCEDERVQAEFILNLLHKWQYKDIKVQTFISAEEFYFEWCENKDFDIILLDIQMSGADGMSLAKRIRNDDENIIIIFVTGLAEYMAEGYEVNAFNYLLKPIDEAKFYACLNKVKEHIIKNQKHKFIVLNTEEGIIKVNEADIIMIESYSHNLIINTKIGSFKIVKSLSALAKELDEKLFFRCHRSVIVNLKHIEKIKDKEVYLTNNCIAPVSRRLYADLNKNFINYYREKLDV
ncbi:MAG: LytTR family DNA-binding domain-containing protein [Clostridiaceae bacterium]|nr:LytTR family DNA-binding domain-containing protein [Clostridiaceae bacterium]